MRDCPGLPHGLAWGLRSRTESVTSPIQGGLASAWEGQGKGAGALPPSQPWPSILPRTQSYRYPKQGFLKSVCCGLPQGISLRQVADCFLLWSGSG